MKVLSKNDVAAVSGAGLFDNVSLYGGGYVNSTNDYNFNIGAGYTFEFDNSSLTTGIGGFNFSDAGNSAVPTFGISYSW